MKPHANSLEGRTQPGNESTERILWSPKEGILESREGSHHFLRSCSLAIHYIMWAQILSFHKGGPIVDEGPMGCLKGIEQQGISQ